MVKLQFLLPAALGMGVLAASLLMSSAPPAVTQDSTNPGLPPGPMDVTVVNKDPISVLVMNDSLLPPAVVGNPDLKKHAALPVFDVREAARKPFAFWAPFDFESAKDGRVLWTDRQTAPADQFVVLEYVNVEACSQPGEKISVNLYVTYDYGPNQKGQRALKILMTEQGVFQEDDGVYLHLGSSQQMKIYIQPGQQYWFQVWRQGDQHFRPRGHAEGAAWMSGYLLPAVQVGDQR